MPPAAKATLYATFRVSAAFRGTALRTAGPFVATVLRGANYVAAPRG